MIERLSSSEETNIASEKEIIEVLGRLPKVIENAVFFEECVYIMPKRILVPMYVASELGFSYPGRYFLDKVLYPQLEEAGVYILDPFVACGEFLSESVFDQEKSVKENTELWNKFNQLVGFINYRILIPRSQAIIAISEGGHLDDGVSAEVVYAVTRRPPISVFAVRSDFRKSENVSGLNPANTYFMTDKFRSKLIEIPNAGRDAYDSLVKSVRQFTAPKIELCLSQHPTWRENQKQLIDSLKCHP